MTGAYLDPNDDLNPWILLTLTWFNTQVKPTVEFDGALPSCDIGWIDESEKVPREGLYKKTYIGASGKV
jgi:hypothetical protein